MDYLSFKEDIYNRIANAFGEQAEVRVRKVVKNNATEYDCLSIFEGDTVISPNFYLQTYYKRYTGGEEISMLVEEILEQYDHVQEKQMEIDCDLSLERVQDRIVYRLVSMEQNREILRSSPHIPFLDLAVVFYCLMMQTDEGIGSIRIDDALARRWEMSTEMLYQMAKENTVRLFPKRMCPLERIMKEEMQALFEDAECEEEMKMLELFGTGEADMPYVLTNSNGINGAAAILYPDCLRGISDMMGGDFYILPSSIHEVLLVSAKTMLSERELLGMVKEVNGTCVLPDEVLSENIYRYRVETGIVEICSSYPLAG